MRRLVVFNLLSADGYFAGANGDIRWFVTDAEFQAFSEQNAKAGGVLIFGRVTYDFMANYWQNPEVAVSDPVVAEWMNRLPKIVFSRKLTSVSWQNPRLAKGEMTGEIRKLKQEPGSDVTILGS